MQLLDIEVHCLVKKLWNRLAFTEKSVLGLLSSSSCDINGILLPFTITAQKMKFSI